MKQSANPRKNAERAALAVAMMTQGFNFRSLSNTFGRAGNRVGPGVPNNRPINSHGGFGASLGKASDTRNGMPRPPHACEHYDDYLLTRQLKRALARLVAKDAKHNAWVLRRRAGLSGRKATRGDHQANVPVSA
jgi:hypothetical protein